MITATLGCSLEVPGQSSYLISQLETVGIWNPAKFLSTFPTTQHLVVFIFIIATYLYAYFIFRL